MQAAFLFLLTFFFTLFLSSCGNCSRKIDCPGYKDDTLDSWFPYRNNQQLIFGGSGGQRDTFTLRNTETTAPYQATGGILGPPLHCDARKVFQSAEVDTSKRRAFNLTLQTSTDYRAADFSMHGETFTLYNTKGEDLWRASSHRSTMAVSLQPTLTVNNRTFTNVVEATGDTLNIKEQGVYKIYFSMGDGLVGYSHYPSLQTWVKQ